MVGPLHGALSSLLVYLVLCAVATATGRGLLRLLALRPAPPMASAPVAALVVWSLALGIGVELWLPVKVLAPWLWAATALLAANGMRGPWGDLRAAGASLALAAAVPPIVMAPYFQGGLSDHVGSLLPDGWSYVAAAQYLWEHARGTDGTPVLLYQYAQHLSHTRLVSFSVLGFLSPLVSAGDPQAVSGLYQAWTLFTTASAVAAFAAAAGFRPWMALAVTLLASCAGWIANLVWANNFDNAIALVYMPALAAALRAGDAGGWRWPIARGALAAGVVYSYPELAPVVAAGAVLIALPITWREWRGWRAWPRETTKRTVLVAVLLLSPGAFTIAIYLAWQIAFATAPDRPGQGMFPGLLVLHFQPAAFWGLGGEHLLRPFRIARNLVGAGLSLLAIAGLVALAKRREWGLVAVVMLLSLGVTYLLFVERYAYGAYKLLVLGWWGVAVALVAGAEYVTTLARGRALRWALAAAAAVLLAAPVVERHTDPKTTAWYLESPSRPLSMVQFRRVRAVGEIVGQSPVLIAVDDWFASEWAVYYLRDVSGRLAVLRMYLALPHVAPLMRRAPPIDPGAIRYVLTDADSAAPAQGGQRWTRRWSSPPYALWVRVDPPAR
jgi:hypothetical protein